MKSGEFVASRAVGASVSKGLIAFAIFTAFLAGCVEPKDAAKERASREFNCPQEEIRARYVGESQIGEVWQVRACGVVATYACAGERCLREADDRRVDP